MRYCALWSLTLALVGSPLWAQDEVAPPPAQKVEKVSQADVSYSIGLSVGRSIVADDIEVNLDEVVKGLRDAVEGKKPRLTDEQIQQVMTAFQREMQAKMLAKQREEGQKNEKEGKAFLVENKKKPGVQELPSGLQYKVLKSGKGASPKATDTVRTHYHGTLIDGTVFDSSVERGQPVNFRVNQVIKGWTEALQNMKVGDKWQIVIPADLAYGPQGTPDGTIPPNSTLIFEVELLGINEQPRQ